jgi:Domain of unknown function (DUF397)
MSQNGAKRPMQPTWRKASFCGSTECVEVGRQDHVIIVRDSGRPHGSTLRYTFEEWRSFVRNIKDGGFDGFRS